MREQAVLHAGQEHHGELQALSGVQGHEGDHALRLRLGGFGGNLRCGGVLTLRAGGAVRDRVGVGNQRHVLEELFQVGAGVLGLELDHGVQQFGEVLNARLILNILGGAQSRQVSGLLKDRFQAGCGGFGAGNLRQVIHEAHELGVLLHRGSAQAGDVSCLACGGVEGDAVRTRVLRHHGLRLGTDTALGLVQDAAHVHVVIGVAQGAQVGERILDFLTLVEAGATDHAVGQAGTHEHVLEGSGLRVGAVEDSDVTGLHAVFIGKAVNFAGDVACLGVLGFGDVTDNLRTRAGGGPQLLRAAVGVALNDRIRRREDVLRGAVVLLEQDRVGVRVVLLEVRDIADIRAAEGVNGLVGVTHHGQFGRGHRVRVGAAVSRRLHVGADQFTHQLVLGVVRVLVLVHEDVAELAAVVVGDFGELLQQEDGAANQVVKVEGVGGAQTLRVDGVNLRDGLLVRVIASHAGGVRLSADQFVLQRGNTVAHCLGGELLGVQVELFDDEAQQALRVGRIVDGEGGLQAQGGGLTAQHAHAEAVKGRDPHVLGARADQRLDTFTHFGGSLVGEGDGEDLAGGRAVGCKQVGDAVGEHAGLAGAGARDDEQGRAGVQHGFFLAFVEPGGEGGGVHRIEAVGAFAVGVGGVEVIAVAADSVSGRHEVAERVCGGEGCGHAGFRNGRAISRGTVGGHAGGQGGGHALCGRFHHRSVHHCGVHGRGVVVVLGRGYVVVGVEGRLIFRYRCCGGDEFGGEQAVLFGEGLLLLFGLVAHHLPRCLEYTFDIPCYRIYSAAPTRSVNQPHNLNRQRQTGGTE